MSLTVDVVGDTYAVVSGKMFPIVKAEREPTTTGNLVDGKAEFNEDNREWFLFLLAENGVMMMLSIPDEVDERNYPTISACKWLGDTDHSLDADLRIHDDGYFVPTVPVSRPEMMAMTPADRLLYTIFGHKHDEPQTSKASWRQVDDIVDLAQTIAEWSVMPVVEPEQCS